LVVAIAAFPQNSENGPYKPTWESLDTHKMPEWYNDAKIGLSMHWGVYSVPAWAPREKVMTSISLCKEAFRNHCHPKACSILLYITL
jgi:hypothetical protein